MNQPPLDTDPTPLVSATMDAPNFDAPCEQALEVAAQGLAHALSDAALPQGDVPAALCAAQEARAFVATLFDDDAAANAAESAPDAQVVSLAEAVLPVAESWVPDAVPAQWPAMLDVAPMQGQHVLVLGLGASGLAMARWCARAGAQVTVADTRPTPPQLAVLRQELAQAAFVSGPLAGDLLAGRGVHWVLRSPGLSPHDIAPVMERAQQLGIPVRGEVSLFFAGLHALNQAYHYAPSVVAITGTNGKTTVTSLTGQLVERAGKTVAIAGNIGPTLLDTLSAHIDAISLPQVWVLELSSFQLDGTLDCEPHAATVLNITQDHLDWHGGMPAYAGAKARIFGCAGVMVLNREDPAVMSMLPAVAASKTSKAPAMPERVHITFGGDTPKRPGDFGIEVVNGMAWLVRAGQAEPTSRRTKKNNEVHEDLHIQRLMPADALRIRGRHNAINALSALALAASIGCAMGPMLYGLREYRGEPHRVEPVVIVNEVEYFDDSKGTNVGATVAALMGLGAERRLVVILGGDGKGQDFSPLAAPVARYARAVVLIGRDAGLIRAALGGVSVPLFDAADLPQAVELAAQHACAGDAVLLSPACASFDMFSGYEHRAKVFCDAVYALAQESGQFMERGL